MNKTFFKLLIKNTGFAVGVILILAAASYTISLIVDLFKYNDMYGFILLIIMAIIAIIVGKTVQDYKASKYR